LAPFSNQASPDASAITWAFETIGTATKSKVASVIVGIAGANQLKSWVYLNDPNRNSEYIFANNVVVAARDQTDVGAIAQRDAWTRGIPDEEPAGLD
jgi:hypothetical protein